MSNWKYKIEGTEVSPLNAATTKFDMSVNENAGVVFTVDIDEPLVFNYSDNFNFKQQEEDDRCSELSFVIQKKCSGVWADYWVGVFSIAEGEFDDDKCTYTIKPRIKEYLLEDLEINFLEDPIRVDEGGVVGVRAQHGGGGSGFSIYTNCRYFENFLLFIAKKSNPLIQSVISDFFQINPTSAFYLPGVTNYWDKMVVAAVSDIQFPLPSNVATKELVTFGKIMLDLNTLFNVYWFIDSNYNLRIEHYLWFEGSAGLDLTEDRYAPYVAGKNKYTYDVNKFPKKESWKIANHRQTTSLTYGGLANVGKESSEKIRTTNIIRTDYDACMENPSNSGVFLMATDGGTIAPPSWRMLQGGEISVLENVKLSPHYLVPRLQTYGRPSLYALIASTIDRQYAETVAGGIILDSTIPVKKQVEFEIPLCCADSFDIKDQITTPLGTAYVDKATFNSKTEMLSLALKYKIDNCSSFEPSDLPDLDLWLKYNDVLYDTPGGPYPTVTTVRRWNDSSGNGRHAVQATTANKPTYVPGNPNGNPVSFVSTSSTPVHEFLATPAFQMLPGKRGTVFILIHPGGGDYGGGVSEGEMFILSTQDGTASTFFDLSRDNLVSGSKYISIKEGIDLPLNYTNLGVYVLRRSADELVDGRNNGVASTNNPVTVANDQPTSKPLIVGGNPDTSFPTQAGQTLISEVIIYGRDLSDKEIEDVELYLVKKAIYNIYSA